MNDVEFKLKIENSIKAFKSDSLKSNGVRLLNTLGYNSDKTLYLVGDGKDDFVKIFDDKGEFRPDKALFDEWREVRLLFQVSTDEIQGQSNLFIEKSPNLALEHSYLFFTIELDTKHLPRGTLAQITREINRIFDMPVFILFKYGEFLCLSIIDRRPHKGQPSKNVLKKVTLIKDINLDSPHRAHVEILFDLSFDILKRKKTITNWEELHKAWKETLNIQELNKQFFTKVRNWFYWARLHTKFPEGAKQEEALIRLLTRMIFCWFLKEKKLITADFFAASTTENLLKDWKLVGCERDIKGRYYKAILQNLFFATLATPLNERKFRSQHSFKGVNPHYGDQRFFRFVNLFIDKAPVEEHYQNIPFLNGGLFENLDEIPNSENDFINEKRIDGFSDVASKQCQVPDFLFFGNERPVPEIKDMIGVKESPKAEGLLEIFQHYKFTIEENTPLEEDIALDPELLGRTFENLLAEVNPETGATARKSTGSFYTPREIVHYMVSESLYRYLYSTLSSLPNAPADLEERIREVTAEDIVSHRLTDSEIDLVISAIDRLRILDPACGSGAFPMGVLQLIVHILGKIDPGNERWKVAKLASLPFEMRKKAEEVFQSESFDYSRKLELIKDCIHGVDIQPAAIQIAKLRFFLSLVIEQDKDKHVRPLPNLETKFVCANALIGLNRPENIDLFQRQIESREQALLDSRTSYFYAATKKEKDVLRRDDRKFRLELSDYIKGIGGSEAETLASAVAEWDPYHGDRQAEYFDPESMFGNKDGFDITIGNPPYVRADEQSEWNKIQRQAILESKQ